MRCQKPEALTKGGHGEQLGVRGCSAEPGACSWGAWRPQQRPAPCLLEWPHATEKGAGRRLGGGKSGSQQTLPSSPDVGADVRQAKWFSR